MKLKIPDIAIEGLRLLNEMNDEEVYRVFEIIENLEPEMNWQALRSQISNKDEDRENVIRVFEAIRGLYDFRLRTDKPIGELVTEVIESALEDETLKSKINDKEKFSERLNRALSFNNSLGITAKAENVMSEHQNVFVESKILTDLRPIFSEEIDEDNPVTTIIHNLRITYFADNNMKSMVFALDSEDIDKLEEIIARARSKEKRLKEICSASEIKCLR